MTRLLLFDRNHRPPEWTGHLLARQVAVEQPLAALQPKRFVEISLP